MITYLGAAGMALQVLLPPFFLHFVCLHFFDNAVNSFKGLSR